MGTILLVGMACSVSAKGDLQKGFSTVTFWCVERTTSDEAIEKQAKALARSGIDGVVIGGGGHHYLHDDLPRLDLYIEAASRIVKACHAHGIKVAEHHSVALTASKHYAVEHADWVQRDFATGEASVWPEYQTYAFCPNSPEFREHYWKIAKDLMQRSGADALMSDDTVFHHGCCCAACAKRLKDEVGGDIREAYEKSRKPGTPEWRKFNEVRRAWYKDFRTWLRERQKTELPSTTCVSLIGSITSAWGTQTHGGSVEGGLDTADIGIWEVYNPADFYSWRRLSSETAALAEAARVRGVTPLCMPYADTAEKRDVFDKEEQVFMWGLARAHSMPFTLARVFLTGLTEGDAPCDYFIFERDRLKPYLDAEPAATVGVVFSHCSRDNDPKWESSHSAPAIAWAEALNDECVPWRAITEETFDKGLPKSIRTLILPNVFALSEANLRAIEDFVRDGGRLIATGTPAACDQWGETALPGREDRLERLFGAGTEPAEPGFHAHSFGKGRVLYTPSMPETKAFQDWMNSGQRYSDPRDKNVSRALAELVSDADDSQPVRITRARCDARVLTTVYKSGRRLLIYILNCSGADLTEGRVIPRPSRVVWASPVELTLTFPKAPKAVRLISLDSQEDKCFSRPGKSVTLTSPRRFGLVVADF